MKVGNWLIVLLIVGCSYNSPSSAIHAFSEDTTNMLPYLSKSTQDSLKQKIIFWLQQTDHYPWLKRISAEHFYEYLFPHTIDGMTLSLSLNDKRALQQKFEYALKNYDDCRYSPHQLGHLLIKNIPLDQPHPLEYFIPYVLFFRELGLPVTIDFFPVISQQIACRYWFYFPDNCFFPTFPKQMKSYRNGKVYRKMFSPQPIPQPTLGEYIPPFFRNPYQKDVTNEYLHTQDLTLHFYPKTTNRNAYLALFNDSIWQPIAWSEIQQGKCHFKHLSTGNIYLPIYYQDSSAIAWGEPFLLTFNGKCHTLNKADSLTTLSITHPVPYTHTSYSPNMCFSSSRFESADDKNFTHISRSFIADHPHYHWGEININPPCNQRYWRHIGHHGFPCYLAELQFIDTSGQIVPATYFTSRTQDIKQLNDGEAETFYKYIGWLGVDLGQAVAISKIRYLLPQKHRICQNHQYQLYYFQQGEWHIAGVQTAKELAVTFTKVPANVLYRLQDLETLVYSPIFTFENQKITFW